MISYLSLFLCLGGSQHGATLYSIQLGLNLAWMPTFFKFKQPALAAVDIVSLLGVTSYLTYTWSQVDEVAAWALVPYLGWLGFATYLNVGASLLSLSFRLSTG